MIEDFDLKHDHFTLTEYPLAFVRMCDVFHSSQIKLPQKFQYTLIIVFQ